MPVPMPVPAQQTNTNLPTTMPDPKQYVTQRQPNSTITQTSTPPIVRIEKTNTQVPAVKTVSTDHKVLVKETPVVINTPVKVFQPEKPTPVSTVSTVIASDPIHVLTTSPTSTPGAFPETAVTALEKESRATNKLMDLKRRDGIDSYGSFPEDQGSVSTKVGSIDGGSVRGDRTISKVEYLRGLEHNQKLAATAEEVDAAILDRYHTEKFGEQYRYTEEEEEENAHYRNEQRREGEHDIISDDIYDDPYSPTSGDRLSFYEDADDISRVDQRRYFDDDESQLSGSIAIRDRGDYYSTRPRYEERDYDRSYQQYSSSVPTRQYINERELDRAEWSGAGDNVNVASYAREQYPSPREYPRRPTLEDRERELDLINQKNGGTRNTYDRRPATAAGTVANLRRRFSDQSVSEAGSVVGGMVASSQGPRPRGMSGSALNLQQQQQQDTARRDPRYPPRSSTPQSRLAAATAYRYESNVTKGTVSSTVGAGRGVGGRYSSAGGHMSDYEDTGSGRMSAPLGDQRNRRR
ncbi:hypothetical protein BGZ76_000080 [Entomortierella beljakovae]|nr:hypothetical protein BGZ76_000080 [Entomortierella beljakovae]